MAAELMVKNRQPEFDRESASQFTNQDRRRVYLEERLKTIIAEFKKLQKEQADVSESLTTSSSEALDLLLRRKIYITERLNALRSERRELLLEGKIFKD